MAALNRITLPDFGIESEPPSLPVDVYLERLKKAVRRMGEAHIDLLVVYGDREHFANLQYLTGFDPRFEEALLLLDSKGSGKLLVGNECMGYLPDEPLGLEIEMFQPFSLLGQPREDSRPLRLILNEFGIGTGKRVGCVGWKYFTGSLVEGGESALDLPSYMVDLMRDLVGNTGKVTNATAMLMGVGDGLRIINEPEQIACFEYAATISSTAVLDLLRHIRPGVREDELERFLDGRGLPLSCHRMVGFGEKAKRGLSSPSGNRVALGDVFTTALGIAGSLTSRAGCVAASPDDLPEELREFYPRYVANYFDTVTRWYGEIRVGAVAGEVFDAVDSVRDDSLFRFAVNPGHYIHLDEWVHSPFAPGNTTVLRSGMALQADIIPVSRGPFCYSNMEDGVVLADEDLRSELSSRYPAMWGRIQARREFMTGRLGISLDRSVLPMGNTPGWLPPYALDLERVLTQG